LLPCGYDFDGTELIRATIVFDINT
jgi:hypothetical protein